MQSNNWFSSLILFFSSLFSFTSTQAQTVIINGQTLNSEQIQAIEQIYNIKCQSGRYWYDKMSGLVGFEGYPPFTLMHAGYNFGQINSKISGGNTGVFFNGRELSTAEWQYWSMLNGSYIYKGNYWLDAYGNAGITGQQTALVNFYTKAQQVQNNNYNNNNSDYNNYSQRQGNNGGGNAWGTKWSSGNSDGFTHVISSPWGVLDY